MAHVVHKDLAPFLDLFSRMTDDQLSRLTGVSPAEVSRQRREVYRVMDLLEPFEDLLVRLDDEALVRLTEQSLDTVIFWRACCIPPPRLKRGRGTTDESTAPANTERDPARATSPRTEATPSTPQPDDEEDVFVLTIDEDEPAPNPEEGGDDDDPMNWGDL